MTPLDTQAHGPNRDALVGAILAFLGGPDPLNPGDLRETLERTVDAAGPAALVDLEARLRADVGWDYYPRDPLARRIHHLLADHFLERESRLLGAGWLTELGDGPLVIVSNHLSYSDANVIEVLLHRSGLHAVSNRLTALAGPKVFTSRERRFSSLCFGTVKVPQSADVASGEARLNAREIAKASRRAIDVAQSRLGAGDVLLLFAEGTRSRTGRMQPMLAGAARYLDVPGTWVLPAGLSGPEALFPVDGSQLTPARVTVHFGRPLAAATLVARAGSDRQRIVDAIGLAVAELVPAHYRGVYGDARTRPAAGDLLQRARNES